MRKTCLDMVYELARKDPRIFFIGSDLGVGHAQTIQSGDARSGSSWKASARPTLSAWPPAWRWKERLFTSTRSRHFSPAAVSTRSRLDLCLHKAPVRLIGNGGGVVYAPLGPTHEAIEDIAILQALPRMTIVAPADAEEMRRLMPRDGGLSGTHLYPPGQGGRSDCDRRRDAL